MSDVIEVNTLAELDRYLTTYPLVIVDFSALDWCRPCIAFHPHYEAAAMNLGNEPVKLLIVDVDTTEQALLHKYAVQSVPTVMAFKDGVRIGDIKERTALRLIAEIKCLLTA